METSQIIEVLPDLPVQRLLGEVQPRGRALPATARSFAAGETARAGAGQTVVLRLGARRVGTATVRPDGTFSTTVPLPPRSARASNATR